MPSLTLTVAASAASALVLLRREALTAFGYDDDRPAKKPYVGLHTPDTDAVGPFPPHEPGRL